MPEQEAITTSIANGQPFHTKPINQILEEFNVDPNQGLSSDEVSARQREYGLNQIKIVRGSFWKVYLAPILNWLITIYLISSALLLILAFVFPSEQNQEAQALVWLAIVAINCFVAMFQQFRAQKKLEALERLSVGDTRVIRNGEELKVDPMEIVPGDVLKLDQGDKVPADGRIIASSNLATNEASLTGESVPVAKDESAEVNADAPLTNMTNMVFLGTYVATGNARVVTTTTGPRTEIGKIQNTLESLNTGDIPLRKKVNRLAKYLGIAAVILMVVSFAWRAFILPFMGLAPFLFDPTTISAHLSEGITRAMTIMPINIPLLTTIVLLTGVLAMAKKGVIIRDLSAVESLGRVSVVCSDKTGTMTRNQMTVQYVWDGENLYWVEGIGYDPVGSIYKIHDKKSINEVDSENKTEVLNLASFPGLLKLTINAGLNNDAAIVRKQVIESGEEIWSPLGDPTDAALLTFFRKSGLNEDEIRSSYQVIQEFPFESALKRMSKICTTDEGHIAFVKGATEIILNRCTSVCRNNREKVLDSDTKEEISKLAVEYAERGYRVISLAFKKMARVPDSQDAREMTETDLTYLGFTCIVDPPRDGVKEAVNECHRAGINVIMITGDAAATAKTIAKKLDIADENSLVVEGNQIQELPDEDFERVNVFARVNPEHKQVIVERYQDKKRVVAMTGDGVNDVLALAMSDAGIAMGIAGTDVAKEAADLVITDDSFASIVTGIHEGRGLFQKIRMMIYFYVSINVFESIVFFGALFVLPTMINMLTQWQSIYLVVTTHSFPGLALVFDKVSARAMEEKPRDSEEIITRPMAHFMALNVIMMIIGASVVYFLTFTEWMGIVQMHPENLTGFYGDMIDAPMKATVMMLTVILIVESILVLIIRRINMPLHESLREPPMIRYAFFLGLIYLAHLLLMYVPLAQEILAPFGLEFYFMPLTAYDWLICILLSLPTIVGLEVYKRYLRDRNVTL